jgi:hypothetical protein
MKVKFNKLAIQELNEAITCYELEVQGLGNIFREEVKKGIKRIVEYFRAWAAEKGEIRKYLIHKFSYKILYSVKKDHIFIIALAHQHSKPNYWVDRL